jgi:hypothetical protein
VHGDDLLYDFFQHALAEEDPAFAGVPQLLLESMGVWLPLEVYRSWPVLLPFVVRDPNCRPNPRLQRQDAWGSSDEHGYLRDDNSLVKGLPRALTISGPRTRRLSGARLGTEFVAAHVWRTVLDSDLLASRIAELNSFVPNLVWLPGQIAKLTDREGSVMQETAQAMAWASYREAPVDAHLVDLTEACWSRLPEPARTLHDFDPGRLNWFVSTPRFLATRRQRLTAVTAALREVRAGRPLEKKVITTRYTQGLPLVRDEDLAQLLELLQAYERSD